MQAIPELSVVSLLGAGRILCHWTVYRTPHRTSFNAIRIVAVTTSSTSHAYNIVSVAFESKAGDRKPVSREVGYDAHI